MTIVPDSKDWRRCSTRTTFENWDQDATAVAERYGQQDPTTMAIELAAQRTPSP